MGITWQITDLQGDVLATVGDHMGGEVIIPLMQPRTAKLTLELGAVAALHVAPLSRMLKAYYNDHLVYWGVILTPRFISTDAGSTVEIASHDQSIWWKKNYHRYGDLAVDEGYTFDGRGLFTLHESSIPLPQQMAAPRNIPHPGIVWGEDTTTPTARSAKVQRGDNVWSTIDAFTQQITGPEWNLRPIDADFPGVVHDWEPGYFAELNAYPKRTVDRRDDVSFHRNHGRNTLESFEWTPDGDKVINYQVAVPPGGEQGRTDTRKALAHDEASWQEIGIYQAWFAAPQKVTDMDVLQEYADYMVATYHEPPGFFTIVPRTDRGTFPIAAEDTYRYIDHFTEGDEIRASVKDGALVQEVEGRIMQVTLTADAAGRVKQALVCAPNVDATPDTGDEGT